MQSRAIIFNGVLLMLAGSAALLSNGSPHEEFHQIYPLSAQGRLALENINGNVHITAWERNEVKVDAVKRASTQERLDEARIVVDAGPNVISIRTRYDEHHDNQPASVEYTITVPRTARLDEIKLINGAVEISGVSGEVRASSVNGTLKADRLLGDARLSTVNGRLEANFDRLDASKAIALNSVNGSIVLSIPFDAHADFAASNVTGGISNDFGLPVDRGRFIGSQLKASLKGGGTRIKLGNVNGAISILPTVNGRRLRFT